MNTHGVYISFALLIESAAVLLVLLLVGLATASLDGAAFWLLALLVPVVAGVYVWRLWSLQDQHCYGLWELEEEE